MLIQGLSRKKLIEKLDFVENLTIIILQYLYNISMYFKESNMVSKKFIRIGAGVLVGALGGKVLSSQLAKKAAVGAVAGGLRVKESIDKTVEQVRVSADDIVAEAKEANAKEDLERAKKAAELNIDEVAKEDLINQIKEELKEEIKAEIKEDEDKE